MKLPFYKYQGTGNDFIIVDNRENVFDPSRLDLVKKLCDRKFGIGADGLMLLQNKPGVDFEMIFFNPDGSQSLCGNGSRCIVAFANDQGIVKNNVSFLAFDGEHQALIKESTVSVKMKDIDEVEAGKDYYYLNTGSPHYCSFVKDVQQLDVVAEGRKVRYSDRFSMTGTNVNFLERNGSAVFVRTYERGVENETLSCGTGVTASALVAALQGASTADDHCDINTLGGKLTVHFKKKPNNSFSEIWLEGPAIFVFKGEVEVE